MSDDKSPSDIKSSFAWGQLFVGSIVSGLAIWKLALKLMNSEPSAILAGLASAYDEVRDFLVKPLEWVHFDISAHERDVLVLCTVLGGAYLRGLFRLPSPIVSFFLFGSLLSWYFFRWLPDLFVPWVGDAIAAASARLHVRQSLLEIAFALIIVTTLGPVWDVVFGAPYKQAILNRAPNAFRRGVDLESTSVNRLIILSVLFAALWGVALLLLNWATL